MQVSSLGGANALWNKPNAASSPKANGDESMSQVLADFVKTAFKTPEERAKDAILKSHGLTEDQYNALPKARRDAIAKEIAEAVQRVAQRRTGIPGGGAVDSTLPTTAFGVSTAEGSFDLSA